MRKNALKSLNKLKKENTVTLFLSNLLKPIAKLLIVLTPLFSAVAFAVEETTVITQKALPHTNADQMIKMVLGLLFVLMLIFLLAFLFKKYIGSSFIANNSLKTIAGVAVGQKERVVLVQVGERQVLVGVSPGQVSMLYALEKGEEVTVSNEMGKSAFADKLKQSLKRLEKK